MASDARASRRRAAKPKAAKTAKNGTAPEGAKTPPKGDLEFNGILIQIASDPEGNINLVVAPSGDIRPTELEFYLGRALKQVREHFA